MNKVYESDTMVVHDDREAITPEKAFEILYKGESVRICFPPDFSAEDESMIYDQDYPISFTDILGLEWAKLSIDECREKVFEYLRSYEIYK